MKQFHKFLILGSACLSAAAVVCGQAPPGPLNPPPPQPGSVEAAPPPPRKPQVPPRKDILGAWRFNKDESDDPRQKVHQSKDDGSNRGGGGYGGPHIGFPGGGPMGGGGPYGGGGHRTPQEEDSARLGDLVNPAFELQLLRHNAADPEVELIDDRQRRHIFYTDGRKIEKQKDPSLEEVSARWDGNRLITDEKGSHNSKISRTFEVSSDGKQLLETVRVTDSKGNHPVTINYVYDAVEASTLSFPAH
jgi:hypothetical protein